MHESNTFAAEVTDLDHYGEKPHVQPAMTAVIGATPQKLASKVDEVDLDLVPSGMA